MSIHPGVLSLSVGGLRWLVDQVRPLFGTIARLSGVETAEPSAERENPHPCEDDASEAYVLAAQLLHLHDLRSMLYAIRSSLPGSSRDPLRPARNLLDDAISAAAAILWGWDMHEQVGPRNEEAYWEAVSSEATAPPATPDDVWAFLVGASALPRAPRSWQAAVALPEAVRVRLARLLFAVCDVETDLASERASDVGSLGPSTCRLLSCPDPILALYAARRTAQLVRGAAIESPESVRLFARRFLREGLSVAVMERGARGVAQTEQFGEEIDVRALADAHRELVEAVARPLATAMLGVATHDARLDPHRPPMVARLLDRLNDAAGIEPLFALVSRGINRAVRNASAHVSIVRNPNGDVAVHSPDGEEVIDPYSLWADHITLECVLIGIDVGIAVALTLPVVREAGAGETNVLPPPTFESVVYLAQHLLAESGHPDGSVTLRNAVLLVVVRRPLAVETRRGLALVAEHARVELRIDDEA